jgi:hypothetical protein
MAQVPDPADWITVALWARDAAIIKLAVCASPECMLSTTNAGRHHAADCHCYERKHAMIELAKINSQFVHDVRKALQCSGSDSSAASSSPPS